MLGNPGRPEVAGRGLIFNLFQKVVASLAALSSRLGLAVFVVLFVTVAGASAADAWSVLNSEGTVLVLEADRWTDLPPDAGIPAGMAIRTLKGATISLAYEGYVVTLAPLSAARLESGARSTAAVTQFGGTIVIEGRSAGGKRLRVVTPRLTLIVSQGNARLSIAVDSNEVEVAVGSVTVVDTASGARTSVAAGEEFAPASAAQAVAPGNSGNTPAADNANGQNSAAAGNNGNNGNNGNAGGNSGNNGNSGGNGGNGNSNNGNGNAGNNGNNGNNGNGNGNGKKK